MKKVYIGCDNGSSGTIGILGDIEPMFFQVPTFKQLSFQKTKKVNITRIDTVAFTKILTPLIKKEYYIKAILERPMLNSMRFNASISGARALEAILIVFENLDIGVQYLDSKLWQKELLPTGIKGSVELKKASKDIGIRLFPQFKEEITKHKDADGILIAEYAKRHNL